MFVKIDLGDNHVQMVMLDVEWMYMLWILVDDDNRVEGQANDAPLVKVRAMTAKIIWRHSVGGVVMQYSLVKYVYYEDDSQWACPLVVAQ